MHLCTGQTAQLRLRILIIDIVWHLDRQRYSESGGDDSTSQGPEIRTGTLKNGGPVMLEKDQIITLTTDYETKGDENTIAVSYKSMPTDVSPGSQILCADGGDGARTHTHIPERTTSGTLKKEENEL